MAKTWAMGGKLIVGNLPIEEWWHSTKELARVAVKIYAYKALKNSEGKRIN